MEEEVKGTVEVDVKELIETVSKSKYDLGKAEGIAEGRLEAEREFKSRPQITIKSREPKNLFGYAFRAAAKAKLDGVSVNSVIDKWQAKESRIEGEVIKSMVPSDLANGGFYLSDTLSNEIIPVLRERTVVRQAGASSNALVGGQLLMRTEGSGAVAYWTGEGSALTQSTITGSQVELSSKRLGTFVVVNNKLLEYANPQLEDEVTRDLVYALSYKEDATFLRGTVTQYAPTGIENLVDSSMKFDANSTVSVDNTTKDLAKAMLKLRTANIPMFRAGMIISPRTEYYLRTVRDTNGNLVFKDEMNAGKIYGIPYYVSTVVPDNLGSGSNESKIYIGDFAQAVIGENGGMDVQVVPNGTYHNQAGAAVSGLLTGETVIAAEMHVAFGLKYAKAFSIIEAVKWGA